MRKPRLIDLNDAIQHPGRHVAFTVETSLEDEEDVDLLGPLRADLDAVSTGNHLMITGNVSGTIVLECSRCLKPIEVPLSFAIDEEFDVVGTPAGYGNREYAQVHQVDEPAPMFEHNSLLYENLIRSGLWLNLPMRPLCGDDCKGIAEGHGAEHHGRPEFEALKNLKGGAE